MKKGRERNAERKKIIKSEREMRSEQRNGRERNKDNMKIK